MIYQPTPRRQRNIHSPLPTVNPYSYCVFSFLFLLACTLLGTCLSHTQTNAYVEHVRVIEKGERFRSVHETWIWETARREGNSKCRHKNVGSFSWICSRDWVSNIDTFNVQVSCVSRFLHFCIAVGTFCIVSCVQMHSVHTYYHVLCGRFSCASLFSHVGSKNFFLFRERSFRIQRSLNSVPCRMHHSSQFCAEKTDVDVDLNVIYQI